MADDQIILEISPALLEAIGLPPEMGRADYFTLLGVAPEEGSPAVIDKAVMERSKILRRWQASPKYGEEVVALLPMLHRVAAILKDPRRSDAYRRELERAVSGVQIDPRVEFDRLARAAVADGRLDPAERAQLMDYAGRNGLAEAEATWMIEAAAAQSGPAFTVEVVPLEAEEPGSVGIGAFRNAISTLLGRGKLNSESRDWLLRESARFQVSRPEAENAFDKFLTNWFGELVRHVAAGGVLNDNQARLLMSKANYAGLRSERAYEVLSPYLFTSASREALEDRNLSSPVFVDTEIRGFLRGQKMVLASKRSLFEAPDTPRMPKLSAGAVAILAGIAAIVILGGFVVLQKRKKEPEPVVVDIPPTPTPNYDLEPWKYPKSDPDDGLLRIEPAGPGDPPAFDVKITEVTQEEYQAFVLDMFYTPRPEGWGIDSSLPEGANPHLPITNIRYQDALAYCQWVARNRLKIAPELVHPPTLAQYLRLIKAPLKDGRLATIGGSWHGLRLDKLKQLVPVREHRDSDTLYFKTGQVYDLLTNAAEWGADEKGGQRVILGGDHAIQFATFELTAPRYRPADSPAPSVGFRYVVEGR